jgi:prepilin-type N-terminal cleavage/methylation domain-containing protein
MNSSKLGFTLIEVLVALTLLGLIATMVAAGTRLGLDLSARGNAKTDALRMEYLQRNILRSQVRGALPFGYWVRENDMLVERIAFEGRQDRIRFVSRYGVMDGPGSIPRWIDIYLDKEGDRKSALILEEHRILPPDNRPDTTTANRIGIGNCAGLRFEYLDRSSDPPNWISTWDAVDQKGLLPSAVRMECNGEREAMRLVIPLDYTESARQGFLLQ